MRLPCPTLISSYPQRHWYQGDYSELDPETGLQAFDLRMYSSRIGRWLSVDPYAQYWSSYLAMGNNPVSRIDPDGGFAICPTCPGGSQFDVYRNSPHYFYYDQGIVSNFDSVVITPQPTSTSGLNGGIDWLSAANFSMSIGELTRQAKIYQIYGKSAQTIDKALSKGRFVHTNGNTYSQGFKGNQYLSSKSVSNSLSTAKFARNLGRGFTGLSLATSGYQLLTSEGTGADYARFAGALLITGTAAIPVAGPFISIGLGVADSFGAFNPIYNSFGD
jgi:RHS repeat-associated protein